MSMSEILSALHGAGRRRLSASIIAARQQVTGTHVLRIDVLRKTVPNGSPVISKNFSLGGHDWRFSCYLNGYGDCNGSHISLFLRHVSHTRTGDATAKVQVSVLDQTRKPWHTRDITEHRFSTATYLTWGKGYIVKHEDAEKHLEDGYLTILCDVTVNEIEVTASAPGPIIVLPFRLHGKLAEAIWNKQKPDLKIEVGGETLAAHRWILEAQSPVFKADLSLASTTAGAGDDTAQLLRVDDMDAEVFKTLLQFIYTNSPPETKLLESATTVERLLVAADRYELENLKLICEEALCRHIDLNSVAAALTLAERHDCSLLRAACMQFLSSPANLEAFMAGDGFEQVKRGCPSALLDLLLNKMARQEQL